MRVRLIAFNTLIKGLPKFCYFTSSPSRLPIIAVKISSGKVREKGLDFYLDKDYSVLDYSSWLKDALKYPSVLEHVVFTFYIEGISRVCSHQLVRHRLASYTQESQRYSESYMRKAIELIKAKGYLEVEERPCLGLYHFIFKATEEEMVEVAEEIFVFPPDIDIDLEAKLARAYLWSLGKYYEFIEEGLPKEDARYILPQAIKTAILMTVNLREFLHIYKLRSSPEAQWEIRELAEKMKEELLKYFPEMGVLFE